MHPSKLVDVQDGLESKELLSAVTECGAPSELVHVTDSPALM
jgi:hypothetical protein